MLIAENRLKSTIRHTIVSPYRSTFKEHQLIVSIHYRSRTGTQLLVYTTAKKLSYKIRSWNRERLFD